MLKPTEETLRLLEGSPFRTSVDAAVASGGGAVNTDLGVFDDDMLTLYAALEYARWKGVSVTFAAGGDGEPN